MARRSASTLVLSKSPAEAFNFSSPTLVKLFTSPKNANPMNDDLWKQGGDPGGEIPGELMSECNHECSNYHGSFNRSPDHGFRWEHLCRNQPPQCELDLLTLLTLRLTLNDIYSMPI